MINPDEAIEALVSIIVLLLGLSIVLKLKGIDIASMIGGLIEIIIQIFIFVFIFIVIFDAISDG